MKRFLRPFLVSFRRWVLSTLRQPVKWYYLFLWKPKPDSLEEKLHQLANSEAKLVFIQVGANDGFQNDPLCKFIKTYDWQGLCFEPQPLAYQQLQKLYRKDKVTPIHAAISAAVGSQDLFRISFSTQRWASGLSSFDRSHLQRQIDSGFVELKCKKYGITPPKDQNTWISADSVKTVTFEQMLSQHEITDLHLLHIDTEGFDYEIFKLFPFQQIHPRVVLIETAHLASEDENRLQNDLTKMGYSLTQFGVDLWAQKG